jgi:Protein of unknown function (DUF791).
MVYPNVNVGSDMMGWFTSIKAFFKIGSKGTKSITLYGKDAAKFMQEFGKGASKFGDDVGKIIIKAGPAIGNGVKAISAGAVALGAAIIAVLSGFIGYLMSDNKVLGPLSTMDIILIIIFLIIVLLIVKKYREWKEEQELKNSLKIERSKNKKKVKY